MEKHSSSFSTSSSFVVDVKKMLADDSAVSRRAEAKRWEAQHIYEVPEWLKGGNTQAYQPQLVSLGPFHHGDHKLWPMEEHKRRAVLHVVKRSNKQPEELVAAINDVAKELMAAYGKDLDDKWRNDKQSFVDMMLTDGCFLLEIMSGPYQDYEQYDPVFSWHGRKGMCPVIRSDMLLVENQLPLLVLKKIQRLVRPNCQVQVDNGPEKEFRNQVVRNCLRQALHEGRGIVEISELVQEVATDIDINLMVLSFLEREHEGRDIAAMSLRPHPLALYHGSLTYNDNAYGAYSPDYKYEMMPSALEIHEAGIKFKKSTADMLLDIDFEPGSGVLSMPLVVVDDSTESLYLNLMAFERLNADAGDLVTAYVIFMDNMIVTAKDVEMLSSKGVLENMLGCDEETAKLFNGTLSRGQLMGPCHGLHKVQCDVKAYCREPWHKWRATLKRAYFRNPWAFVSLVAATILLLATLVQTICTVMSTKS